MIINEARKESDMNWYRDWVRRVEEGKKKEAEDKWDELCRKAGLPTDKEVLQGSLDKQHEELMRRMREALDKPIDTEILCGGHVWVTGYRAKGGGFSKMENWCTKCGKEKGDHDS